MRACARQLDSVAHVAEKKMYRSRTLGTVWCGMSSFCVLTDENGSETPELPVFTTKSQDLRLKDLGEALVAFRRSVPRILLGDSEWKRMVRHLGHLPASAADGGLGFEFQLGDASPAADLALRATPGSRFANWIRESCAFPTAARALSAIADVRSALAITPDFILEFDLIEREELARQEPGFFFANLSSQGISDITEYVSSAAKVSGLALERASVEFLDAATETLPDSVSLAFVGHMPGRAPPAIRIVLQVVTKEVSLVLDALGLSTSLANEPLDVMRPNPHSLRQLKCAVHVDLIEGGQGQDACVGIELSLGHWLTVPGQEWIGMLRRLVDVGWCLPVKAQALRDWPMPQRCMGTWGTAVVRSGINHLKFAFPPGAPTVVKAYAGAGLFAK